MRLPMMAYARKSLLTLLLSVAGLLLSACAGESTAPLSEPALAPAGPSKALIGTTDGVYTFQVNPARIQTLSMGWSTLAIPANAICDLATSSYGAAHWNDACTPQTARLTITATVSNAHTLEPRIDFEPALRFDPAKSVKLYMFVDTRSKLFSNWNILYCPTNLYAECVDESLADPSVAASVRGHMVTRRIKHFSGYVVTNFAEEEGDFLGR